MTLRNASPVLHRCRRRAFEGFRIQNLIPSFSSIQLSFSEFHLTRKNQPPHRLSLISAVFPKSGPEEIRAPIRNFKTRRSFCRKQNLDISTRSGAMLLSKGSKFHAAPCTFVQNFVIPELLYCSTVSFPHLDCGELLERVQTTIPKFVARRCKIDVCAIQLPSIESLLYVHGAADIRILNNMVVPEEASDFRLTMNNRRLRPTYDPPALSR